MKRLIVSATIAREKLDRDGYTSNGRYYGTGEKLWSVAVDGVGGLYSVQLRAPDLRTAKVWAAQNIAKDPQWDASIGAYVSECVQWTRKPSTFMEVGQ